MSEVYGRKWPVVLPFFVATMFSFVTASANSIQTVLITRFLTGFFGCASITCTGGVFVDLWDASQRGNAIVGYTFAVCWIPLTGILQAAILLLVAFTVEESYVPILLSTRAKQLRRETGKETLHAAANEIDTNFKDLAIKFGLRPIQMLATPICLFVTIYSSFIYGLFYASLESFPIIYQQTRGWNEVVGSLPFLVVGLGIIVGVALNVWNQGHYMRAYEANNCVSVPEARLPPMMIASIALPAGLFIMGWTSSQSIPWIAPIIGTFLMGFGYYVIFTSATSYLVDVFQRWGASALAANTFTRSAFAAGLPLIVPYMYSRLGNGWAFSVLGFFSVLNIPVPFVFWKYGARVRKMGKYTANMG
nr:efflux pump bik6 [Quercus suber]